MKRQGNIRLIILVLIIIAAAATRALPLFIDHTWSFTAVGALAIFAGAQFGDKRLAFLIPLLAMALSDVFLGNGFNAFVYAAFVAMVGCGILIRNKINGMNIAAASVGSAFVFYLITNFAFFYPDLYTRDINGIISSYVAGLPFFRNMILGNLFYSVILFGGYALLSRRIPALAKAKN